MQRKKTLSIVGTRVDERHNTVSYMIQLVSLCRHSRRLIRCPTVVVILPSVILSLQPPESSGCVWLSTGTCSTSCQISHCSLGSEGTTVIYGRPHLPNPVIRPALPPQGFALFDHLSLRTVFLYAQSRCREALPRTVRAARTRPMISKPALW